MMLLVLLLMLLVWFDVESLDDSLDKGSDLWDELPNDGGGLNGSSFRGELALYVYEEFESTELLLEWLTPRFNDKFFIFRFMVSELRFRECLGE